MKVEDNEYDDKFIAVFKSLEIGSQKTFLGLMAKEKMLVQVMNHLPRDITYIAFDLKFDQGQIVEVIKKLNTFEHLKKVHFDLSKTTFHTPEVKCYLSNWVTAANNFESSNLSDLRAHNYPISSTYSESNNIEPAINVIKGSVEYLKQSKIGTRVEIEFMNKSVRSFEKKADEIYELSNSFSSNVN